MKIYEAISQAMLDERMDNQLAYAKKVEADIFYMANSRSEYHKLIGRKISEIQESINGPGPALNLPTQSQ